MLEQLLAAEAAVVDATEQRAADAERELASVRASRRPGNAVSSTTCASCTASAATATAATTSTAMPPVPPDLIALVLAVVIMDEGRMTSQEAFAILDVTDRRPVWLLSQVHADKNPERR